MNEKIEMTATELARANMKEFGVFSLSSKVPHIIDGLKKVHRRIIMKMGTSDVMDKVASITGLVMKVHPHADGSISDTVSEMAKPYTNIIPFVKAIGNIGMYGDFDGPSAPRYLDVLPHPFTKDVYFNKTHPKAIKYVPTESGKEIEPVYYVPAIPITLMIYTLGMMIGYKTEIYPIGFNELCELAVKYIKMRNGDSSITKESLIKYTLPDFPTPCYVRNGKVLLSEYRRGNFDAPIVIDGTMDLSATGITFKTLAPGAKYVKFAYTKICDSIKNKKIKYISSIDNLSGDKTDIRESNVSIVLKRGVSPFDILDHIKNEIRFTVTKTPSRIYLDENNRGVSCTPFILLDKWYNARVKSIVAELKQRQAQLVRDQRKAEALVIAHASAKEIFNIFNSSETWEKAVNTLHKKFKLTPFQARYLKDLTMEAITRRGKESLLENLQRITAALKSLQEDFISIPDRMIADVEDIHKKYKKDGQRHAFYDHFYGHVDVLGKGVIRVKDEEEMVHIINRFKNVPLKIVVYHSVTDAHKYIMDSGGFSENTILDIPKEFSTSNYCVSPVLCKYTIGVGKSKTTKIKGLRFKPQPDVKYCAIPSNAIVVDTNMVVERKMYDDIGNKKLLAVSNINIDKITIVTAERGEKDVLKIHRVDVSQKGVALNIRHRRDLEVLYLGHHSDDIILTIPSGFVSDRKDHHLRITNVTSVPMNDMVTIKLGKLKPETGSRLPVRKLS